MSGRQIKRSGSEEGGRDGKRSHASADPESADDLDKDPDEIAKLSKEQLLAWKKEKRRKQNREAQRRRRDRLLCQQSRGMQPGAEKGGSSNESNNGSSQQVSRQAPSMGGAPAAVAPASGQQQQAWLPPQQHNFDLHRFVEMQSRQQSFSAPNLNVGDFHGMGALDGSNPGGSYPAPLLRNNSQNFGNFGNAAPLLRQMSLSQGGGGMPPLLAQNSFEAFAGGTWPPLLHQGSASFSQLGANGVGAVARQNSMPAFLQGMDPSAVAAAAAGGAGGAACANALAGTEAGLLHWRGGHPGTLADAGVIRQGPERGASGGGVRGASQARILQLEPLPDPHAGAPRRARTVASGARELDAQHGCAHGAARLVQRGHGRPGHFPQPLHQHDDGRHVRRSNGGRRARRPPLLPEYALRTNPARHPREPPGLRGVLRGSTGGRGGGC
ncbi:hypothetical protein T484DRAFT_1902750, partial [Baffinella frigidus]